MRGSNGTERNGKVCVYVCVCVAYLRVYVRVPRNDSVCIRACTRARALCTRRAVSRTARRTGSMGLGAGAVGQRRSTPVRLFFRSCVFDLR